MYSFSVPSKTFLIGEYSVLQGSYGLLVGTKPRFEAIVKKVKDGDEAVYEGFSSEGPAIQFLKDRIEAFSNYSVMLHDPHEGKGGLGWSSAQFLLLYAIHEWIQNQEKEPEFSSEKVLETFLNYAWNGQGWAPSGLDVLCQLEGGLMQVTAPKRFDSNKLKSVMVENFKKYKAWPLKEIDFCLIRTGKKVATHAHLSNLHKINFSRLSDLSMKACQSLEVKDEELLIDCINLFRKELEEQRLVEPNSLQIFKQLQDRPEVLAYKGCGALGADVILIILVSDLKSDFQEWVESEGFEVLAGSQDISEGLEIREFQSLQEELERVE